MQVFRYYFKLALSMWPVLLIYVGTFALTMLAIIAQTSKSDTTFETRKPNIAIFDYDNSEFSRGLTKYLRDNSNEIKIDDTDTARKEAVYFQTVSGIYMIPKGFGDDFFAGDKATVDVQGDVSQSGVQANTLVSNYLRLAEIRAKASMGSEEVVRGVEQDTSKHIEVLTKSSNNIDQITKAKFFMNTLVYAFLGLSIAVVSAIMLMFSNKMIRRRNEIGGLSNLNVTAQIFAGNALFTFLMWAVFIGICYMLYPSAMGSTQGLLFSTGAFLFALVCLGISFLVGSVVTNRGAIGGITNVLALGMAFLCGVFVPIQFLGDSVLNISRTLPAYWYVQANEKIAKLTDFSLESLRPIFYDWLIVAAFAVVLFTATFAIRRWRKS